MKNSADKIGKPDRKKSLQDGTTRPRPIKRNEALKPFSREHHHGLLFSWKIREGIKKNIDPQRIRKYIGWFWQNFLLPHFEAEEKYLFPIAGKNNANLQKALADHRELKVLFAGKNAGYDAFSLIQKTLDAHIRFEERILFNEIQTMASADQLKMVSTLHDDTEVPDDWEDQFWV